MSKLGCTCGATIRDQASNLPNKGHVLRDQDVDALAEFVTEGLSSFVRACCEGKRREWIDQHFLPGYPLDQPDGEVIHDYVFSRLLDRTIDIYQCEACGRILMQYGDDANRFRVFAPEAATGRTL
jgi:hypothetical protein